MTAQGVIFIPLAEIRVVNPRARKRSTFQAITTNISNVGLKRPITVHRRGLEEDGTRYDLICGQGRLEALRDLGETSVPALIKDAPEDERHLMSLVENLARKPPSNTALIAEVKRLQLAGEGSRSIAQKLGLDKGYIRGIMSLLKRGEDELIRRVEAGRLPIETAVIIASGKDTEVQSALSEAYEKGLLRGARLRAVQILLNKRAFRDQARAGPKLGAQDLVRAYEHHTQQERAFIRRSTVVTERLAILTSSFRRLLEDDHFVTLLRAEGFGTMPEHLLTRIERSKGAQTQ
jgi:ParB family transcriptional regulator, chromosome partitioning protein